MEIVFVGGLFDEGGAIEGLSDDICHLEESAASFEESAVDDLVGGVDDAGGIAATGEGFVGECQAAETFRVRRFEGQIMHGEPVQTVEGALQTFWEGEGQLNGDTHSLLRFILSSLGRESITFESGKPQYGHFIFLPPFRIALSYSQVRYSLK